MAVALERPVPATGKTLEALASATVSFMNNHSFDVNAASPPSILPHVEFEQLPNPTPVNVLLCLL